MTRHIPGLLLCTIMTLTVACGDDGAASTDTPDSSSVTPVDMPATQADLGARDMSTLPDSGRVLPVDMMNAPSDMADVTPDDMGRMLHDQGFGQEDMNPSDMGNPPVDMASPPVDMGTSPADMNPPSELYVSSSDVFSPGPLQTEKYPLTINQLQASAWAPNVPGEYPVVVFQHGFNLQADYYDTLLAHVASHGFVVVAPQMYVPSQFPVGQPTTPEEAASALALWQALPVQLPAALPTGTIPRADLLGVVGHSRGAKVIWLNLAQDTDLVLAAVGLDPVDSDGNFLSPEPRAIPSGGLNFSLPSLFIGTGLGPVPINAFSPACAPAGDNYISFYDGAQSPAYELTATEYGHLDMLEDNPPGCGLTCSACTDGSGPRGAMRRASAGWIVALMRDVLQGGAPADNVLLTPSSAPVAATLRNK